jgi:alpha-1,6-mannosyltransferase
MRIAQLANFVGPVSGGMKTAVEALGAGYANAGHARLLVMPGPVDRRTSTRDGEVVQLRAPRIGGGYRLLLEPWRVTSLLEEFGPTSIELSDKSTLLPVTRWASRNGVPSLLFSHERLDAMLALRLRREIGVSVPVAVLNRILVRRFDAIVVTSTFARQEFAPLAQAAGTTIHKVPLGVDLEAFRPAEGVDPASGPLRLVHAGRLSREKSPHLAVATAVELHRRGVPVRLDVYGDGPHRQELEDIGRDAPVYFHGHVADRQQLSLRLASADIALAACPGETFGLSVLEALGAGTPVVTADTGGAREIIDPACGTWAEPVPSALADAVLRLAAHPARERRRAARRRAEQFPWSLTVDRMLALHADLTLVDALRARPA